MEVPESQVVINIDPILEEVWHDYYGSKHQVSATNLTRGGTRIEPAETVLEPAETCLEPAETVLEPAETCLKPSAPPMPTDPEKLIGWFFSDNGISQEDNIDPMWKLITGQDTQAFSGQDMDHLSVIQDIQYRESGLLRMYNNGIPMNRQGLMKLHATFYDEYKCRVSDFKSDEEFWRLVISHIQNERV